MIINKYLQTRCNECGHPKRIINGAWLRTIRESANMSQREFGRLCDVTSPYISDIERNRRKVPSDILHHYLKIKDMIEHEDGNC